MKICNSILELVGNTPLIRLSAIEKKYDTAGKIVAKLECMNPAGSAKDRVGLELIEQAEKDGRIKEGSVIIEPTSGNTGIGLAMAALVKGYRVILTMPDTMSAERRSLLSAYGAELVLTDGAEGMTGAVKRAEVLAGEIPDSFIPGQFNNPANPAAHFKTTGPEIWEATDGEADILVATIGTGGTITGTARYLKTKNPAICVVGVEPAASPLLTEGKAGPHKIQGIGANFVPEVFDLDVCDEIMTVTDEDAYAFCAGIAACEGILTGISSGAAMSAAVRLACRDENKDKLIVVVLPDSGERYISTGVFKSKTDSKA